MDQNNEQSGRKETVEMSFIRSSVGYRMAGRKYNGGIIEELGTTYISTILNKPRNKLLQL
jgi:hypothetical protein